MRVLAIDVGGTHVKVLLSGEETHREFVSGPALTARAMVAGFDYRAAFGWGGNVHKLKELPPGCRAGDNANAFLGGFRLWDDPRPPRVAETRVRGRAPRRRSVA